jgi:glycosyltransferase involved in cell wall biosynthesis
MHANVTRFVDVEHGKCLGMSCMVADIKELHSSRESATGSGDSQNGRSRLRRPRVLLSAFSCGPNLGSEPGIGWWRAVEIARHCQVWALVDGNGWEEPITAHLQRHGPIPNLKFIFIKRPRWQYALEFLPLLKYIAYHLWHRRAYRVAKRLHAQVIFDLAHQVTFTSIREPGYLHRLGIPFVWGPVGGAQNYAWRFLLGAGIKAACSEATRTLLNTLQLYGSPRVHAAAKSSAVMFAPNPDHRRQIRKAIGVDSNILCDVGISRISGESATPRPAGGPIRIIWVGLLTARKALELLIEALALLPSDVQYELRVLGQGPRRRSWERLAELRGISAKVRWVGQVSHDEAQEHLRSADVLAFTSLRDATGTVVLEALAAGKPVICLDHQGAGEIVTPQCGIKIPVTNRRDVERRLSDAITLLQRNPDYCAALGRGGRQRAAKYLWSVQACRIAEEYNRILESIGSDARCDSNDFVDSACYGLHDNSFDATSVHVEPLTR